MHKTDVVIIGSGPVGIFAIFQAGMLGMKCHIVDALDSPGGQCIALYPEKPIYDIPAFPRILAGDLVDNLIKQASPFHPTYHFKQQVIEISKADNKFVVKTNKGTLIETKVILIAAGAGAFGPNRPPLENIEQYEEKSVFYYVKKIEDFSGKRIAIAGGGDSAVDWAINLSDVAEKIFLIHRRDKFRAAPSSVQKIEELTTKGKIELVIPYQLHSLGGEDGILSSVNVSDLDNKLRKLDANILLPFFGLSTDLGPINEWNFDIKNHKIMVDKTSYMSNIDGIYAVGDIAGYEGKLKLILTGFAEVATALHHAYPRVFDGKALHFEHSTSKNIVSI